MTDELDKSKLDETILNFWLNNRKYWICISNEIKKEADNIIYKNFYNYFYNTKEKELDFVSKIIYLDQFQRHFSRVVSVSEEDIIKSREQCVEIVLQNINTLIKFRNFENQYDEEKIMFCLMPFKHLYKYDFIFGFLDGINLRKKGILGKFYNDTYSKAYTFETIKKGIKGIKEIKKEETEVDVDLEKVCDFYPEKYKSRKEWNKEPKNQSSLKSCFENYKDKKLIVSLSGGVDSMVMLHVLSSISSNLSNLSAIHLIYGNREESELEFKFVSDFCKRLGVTLYYYRIEWLKRKNIDRDFYESITRQIRFSVYKSVCSEKIENSDSIVLLGHIKEDVVENIWTNISKSQSISNLKKMLPIDNQLGVNIGRPFLCVSKDDIYEYSKEYDIPYLKNTTPSWSNRGKFRERFYTETHLQFGKGVDDRLISFANILEKQHNILEKLVYKYVISTFDKETKSFDITRAIEADLDVEGWSVLFERMCHNYIFCKKPSIHSIKEFIRRITNVNKNKIRIQLVKDLYVIIEINSNFSNSVWKMFFVTERK